MNIPAPREAAALVLMRRSAIRTIGAEVRRRLIDFPHESGQSSLMDQKRALADAARRHGMKLEELLRVIAAFERTAGARDRGVALYLRGKYVQAEKELSASVERWAPDLEDLVETLRYLGAAQLEQAKFQAAADTFRKALALHGEDPELLISLGEVHYALAEWETGEGVTRRALAIDEKKYGPEHPNVARDLNNLAMILRGANRRTEAEPLMRRALATDEKGGIAGPEATSRDLNNLALLLEEMDRAAEAEPLARRALTIDEKAYGEDPKVATDLNTLALVLEDTKRSDQAEPLLRRALAIDERSFGPDHPKVATRLNNLVQVLQDMHRLPEAEPLMRRALAIQEKNYGPDHPGIAAGLNNLATLLTDERRPAEAEPLERRALAIWEKHEGPESFNVAVALSNLGSALTDMQRLAEAEPLIRRALGILVKFKRRSGWGDGAIQTVRGRYSSLLQRMGKSRAEIDAAIEAVTKEPG